MDAVWRRWIGVYKGMYALGLMLVAYALLLSVNLIEPLYRGALSFEPGILGAAGLLIMLPYLAISALP
ncbi:hypothetical protein [Ferrimonas marina]|uniref:Uncharacterized protein n=1 Tax=Ferrimonas marina TaxID=299255 RepID=A0A1M5ZB44_9GAMM|nr:hypothetical protein [Ferrimonas marina]SHI21440.1 hypothetical protein SAMN02745129_0136 [Ferrimonas marina]